MKWPLFKILLIFYYFFSILIPTMAHTQNNPNRPFYNPIVQVV